MIPYGPYGDPTSADLAVIESPAYSRGGAGKHDQAGQWWSVVTRLVSQGTACAFVAPNQLKAYATGNGGASKAEMIAAANSVLSPKSVLGKSIKDYNEADALWLRAMGCDWANVPLAQLPAAQRRVLCEVSWPNLVRRK